MLALTYEFSCSWPYSMDRLLDIDKLEDSWSLIHSNMPIGGRFALEKSTFFIRCQVEGINHYSSTLKSSSIISSNVHHHKEIVKEHAKKNARK